MEIGTSCPLQKWEQFEGIVADRKTIINRLNNAYWLAHRLLQSKARVVYGSVYAIPAAIGPVDIAVYGAVLLHLRDPFLALQNGLKLTTHSVIVAEGLRGQSQATTEPFLGYFQIRRRSSLRILGGTSVRNGWCARLASSGSRMLRLTIIPKSTKAGIFPCTRSLEREHTEMSNRGDSLKSPRRPFVLEALKLENFPFVVLFLLATISLISRIWLMLR